MEGQAESNGLTYDKFRRLQSMMSAATPKTPHARAARYREQAAELRRLADRLAAGDSNRQQLLNLAQDFDELADSIGQTSL